MYLLRSGRYIYHSETGKLQVFSVRKGDKDVAKGLGGLSAAPPSEQEHHCIGEPSAIVGVDRFAIQ